MLKEKGGRCCRVPHGRGGRGRICRSIRAQGAQGLIFDWLDQADTAVPGCDGAGALVCMRVARLKSPHASRKAENHPDPWTGMSPNDRAIYEAERRRYWEQEWDSGRFNGLPTKP